MALPYQRTLADRVLEALVYASVVGVWGVVLLSLFGFDQWAKATIGAVFLICMSALTVLAVAIFRPL